MDTCDILAVVNKNKEFLFLLHDKNNRYTISGHAISVATNPRIPLLKILVLGSLGYLKKPSRFPILPLRSRTHWHGLKRRGALNVRNLEASSQSSTFDSFTKKMSGYLLEQGS